MPKPSRKTIVEEDDEITSVNNVEGYIAESVFKLNCTAKMLNIFEEFLGLIAI